MSKEKLKILLYRLLDNIEYEYTRANNIAYHNMTLSDITDSDSEDCTNKLLLFHETQSKLKAARSICSDIARILDNDREL